MQQPEEPRPTLRAAAWHGAPFDPAEPASCGVLTLEGDRLSYQAEDDLSFDVPLQEVAKVDFAYGDGVMAFEVRGRLYRLFFAPPPATADSSDRSPVSGTEALLESRTVGKRFRAALEGHAPPSASEAASGPAGRPTDGR